MSDEVKNAKPSHVDQLARLRARRETLLAAVRDVDQKIAQKERALQAVQLAEIAKIAKSANLTPDVLRAMLSAKQELAQPAPAPKGSNSNNDSDGEVAAAA